MTATPETTSPAPLTEVSLDRIMRSVVAMAAELSVLRERVRVLEAEAGIDRVNTPVDEDTAAFVAHVFGRLHD